MGKLSSPDTGFTCRYEIGPYAVSLDRYGLDGTAFEARLRVINAISSDAPVGCGCAVFVEHNEDPCAVVDRLIRQLNALSRCRLDDKALAEFRDVAKLWLMFNFRPAIDSSSSSRVK